MIIFFKVINLLSNVVILRPVVNNLFNRLAIFIIGYLEWILSSPPKPHAFVSLPLQSTLFKGLFNFQLVFNWKKYLKTIFFVIIGIGIKSICQYFFGAEDTSIEKLILGLDYSFYLGCILGSWILIIFQDNWNIKFSDFYSNSLSIKLDSGDENSDDENIKKSWKGKDKIGDSNTSTQESDKKLTIEERAANKYLKMLVATPTVNFITVDQLSLDEKIKASIVAGELSKDTYEASKALLKVAQQIEDSKVLDLNKININDPTHADMFGIGYLRRFARLYTSSLNIRIEWLTTRLVNLDTQGRSKVAIHLVKIEDIRDKYENSVRNINSDLSPVSQAKVFFSLYNEQRKLVNKELIGAEVISIKGLKTGPFCKIDHQDSKDFLKSLKDYNNSIEKFKAEDNYLKKKISEMMNK